MVAHGVLHLRSTQLKNTLTRGGPELKAVGAYLDAQKAVPVSCGGTDPVPARQKSLYLSQVSAVMRKTQSPIVVGSCQNVRGLVA